MVAGVALCGLGTLSEGAEDVCRQGSFSSESYLYSIALPEGLSCCHDPAPNPVHGCLMTLPGKRESRLWVDGSYNALDFNSAEDALRSLVGGELAAGTTLTVLRHAPAKLGGLEAVRMTLRIQKQGGGEATIEDRVVALAIREGREDLLYTVGFTGPEAEYSQYEKTFSRIVASWKAGDATGGPENHPR
jgi:hypothetical protein